MNINIFRSLFFQAGFWGFFFLAKFFNMSSGKKKFCFIWAAVTKWGGREMRNTVLTTGPLKISTKFQKH